MHHIQFYLNAWFFSWKKIHAKGKIGICETDTFSRFCPELLLKCPANTEMLTMVSQNNNLQAHILVICNICIIVDQFWAKDVKIENVTSDVKSSQKHIWRSDRGSREQECGPKNVDLALQLQWSGRKIDEQFHCIFPAPGKFLFRSILFLPGYLLVSNILDKFASLSRCNERIFAPKRYLIWVSEEVQKCTKGLLAHNGDLIAHSSQNVFASKISNYT